MASKTPTKNKVELKLSDPFEYAGETVEILHLSRPTADDISELGGSTTKLGDLVKIGLKLAALPPTQTTMKLLSAKDGIALSEAVGNFL